MNAYAPPLPKKSRRRKVTVTWWNTGRRNDAEKETVERLSASDASDQASLGSNSASEQSRSWSQLIRSSRLRQRHQRRASQPTALCGGGPIRRSQAASTLAEGENSNGVFLDGSHDGDKTRERKRKGLENKGKNNKKKNSSLTKFLLISGSWVRAPRWAPL